MAITLADAIIRILPDDTELGPGFAKARGAAQSFATDLSGKVVAAWSGVFNNNDAKSNQLRLEA